MTTPAAQACRGVGGVEDSGQAAGERERWGQPHNSLLPRELGLAHQVLCTARMEVRVGVGRRVEVGGRAGVWVGVADSKECGR